jgi:hypothetical protein
MRRLPSPPLTAAALAFVLPLCVHGQAAPARPAGAVADAVLACERAARQSLASRGAPAAEVKFAGTPAEQAGLSNAQQLVLHGAGHWRDDAGARKFDYSCNVDLRTPEAVGLVLRDTTPPGTPARPARPALEPDLTHVSPAACEASAALALKKRWPRVSAVSFDAATRSLAQESVSKAELHGQGRAVPEPGAPTVLFSFDCEIDPRNGRVLGTRLSG